MLSQAQNDPLKSDQEIEELISKYGTTFFLENNSSQNLPSVLKMSYDTPSDQDMVLPDFGKDIIQYITKRIKFPKKAKQNGIAGKVKLNFIVTKEGYVTNVKVAQGIGFGCDEEAKRVIENLPRFKSAARQNGRPVNFYYSLVVNFSFPE